MRHLGLLFGNTVYAAATILTAFFAGLALGNAALGNPQPETKAALEGLRAPGIGCFTKCVVFPAPGASLPHGLP